jgi:hypothetical protein
MKKILIGLVVLLVAVVAYLTQLEYSQKVTTQIDIQASPKKVWSRLVDIDSWHTWNPIIAKAGGEAVLGGTLNITMRGADGGEANSYSPIIIKLDKPNVFKWRGKVISEIIFTNDKIFELYKTDFGTHLVHTEYFSGMLLPIFESNLKEFVPSMLNSMNSALKIEVERE